MPKEARHSTILIAGTGATALISFSYRVYAGRVLEPAEFADFSVTVGFILICCVVMGPINSTVARFTAQFAARGEYGKIITLSRAVSRRVILAGFALLLIGLLLATPLTNFLNLHSRALLPVAYVAVLLALLLSVARGTLRGLQRFSSLSWNALIEAVVRFAAGFAILAAFVTPVGGVAAFVLAAAVAVAVSRAQLAGWFRKHSPCPLDGAAVRRFALPMFLASLAKGGFEYFDTLTAKHFLGHTELAGCYVAAASLSLAVGVLAAPFATLLLPLLTSLQERGRRTTPTFLRICAYFVLLAVVPALIFRLQPKWVLDVTFSGVYDYSQAAPWLFPLLLARVATYLSTLIGILFLTRNDYRFLAVYFSAFALEVVGLFIWHDSPEIIVRVVLTTQVVCLVAMIGFWRWACTRSGSASHDSQSNGGSAAPESRS